MQAFIIASADVKAKTSNSIGLFDRATPLHWAAKAGNAETVQTLISAGGSVNARTKDGGTPVHRTAEAGNAETVKALASGGANLNVETSLFPQTPLHFAAKGGKAKAAHALIAADAKVNAKDLLGKTPLDRANMEFDAETKQVLITASANTSGRKRWWWPF